MITKINLYKQSLHSDDHMVVATPVNYNPKSQRILVSVNNKVAEADYNPQTKNVTAKLVVPQNNTNHPLAAQLPKNADIRVKVFVYDFLKDKILGAKLQEFSYNTPTLSYKPSDELLTTSAVIIGNWDKKGLVEKAKVDEKIEKILIKKIEGPENVFEEKEYEFKIVEWSKKEVKLNELISKIKWGYTVDAGKLVYITTKALIDKKANQIVLKWKIPKVEGAKIAVYAWLEQKSEEVKVGCNVKSGKFPILIVQGKNRKGRNVLNTGIANDLLYNDYEENETGFKKLYKEIFDEEYRTSQKDKYSKSISEKSAKLFAEQKLIKIKKYLKSNKELFDDFKNEAAYFAVGRLEENILLMIDKFKKNEGGVYENRYLTDAVINHINSKIFMNGVNEIIKNYIVNSKGNLENLEINDDTNGILYKTMLINGLSKPTFNNVLDNSLGLRIAINDLWAYKIFIKDLKIEGTSFKINIQYEYYDHFGLDFPDIHKFDNDIFFPWFVLQHFRGFKPFITKIKFNVIIKDKFI